MFDGLNLSDSYGELVKILESMLNEKNIEFKTDLTENQIKVYCQVYGHLKLLKGEDPEKVLLDVMHYNLKLRPSMDGKRIDKVLEGLKGVQGDLKEIAVHQAINSSRTT